MKLANQRVLITGSNRGFGRAVAKAFVAEGASVMLCARNAELLGQVRRELAQSAPSGVQVSSMPVDVSDAKAVDSLFEHTVAELGGLDTMVCNAGVQGPKGPTESVDWKEWIQTIHTNLAGVVLTCRAALPYLKQRRAGKIIILSGGGATKPMPFLSAYAASKAGVVRFGETLAEEVKEFGVTVNMVAPGALNTRMLDEVLEAGPDKVGQALYEKALKQKERGGAPLQVGASLCVYLASDASNQVTGKLISAIWDPWDRLADHSDDLKDSDIYTLRRIVPAERGKDWG
jgi:NAD(P)-dependent dehydrogenase (short-subunit alcohol dehydrogenase family)